MFENDSATQAPRNMGRQGRVCKVETKTTEDSQAGGIDNCVKTLHELKCYTKKQVDQAPEGCCLASLSLLEKAAERLYSRGLGRLAMSWTYTGGGMFEMDTAYYYPL